METEYYVETQLSKFLDTNLPGASKSAVDEIVLSYVVSILEELGSEAAAEDAFDVEQFTEMMDAYIPGFAEMDSVAVTEWMFKLSADLEKKKKTHIAEPDSDPDEKNGEDESCGGPKKSDGGQKRTHSTSEREDLACAAAGLSESESDSGKEPVGVLKDPSEQDVELLMEMFPNSCHLEIAHCLAVTKGNVEQAAQLILHRQDAGDSITSSSSSKGSQGGPRKKSEEVVDDKKLKQSILNKYSFIDTRDDKVDHRPVMPKMEPKKLIRYLDNKIVTTKGERFVEIKKDDEAEVVKKTSVHLKPARQYRFH